MTTTFRPLGKVVWETWYGKMSLDAAAAPATPALPARLARASRQPGNRVVRTDTLENLLSVRNPVPSRAFRQERADPGLRDGPWRGNRDSPGGDSHITLRCHET